MKELIAIGGRANTCLDLLTSSASAIAIVTAASPACSNELYQDHRTYYAAKNISSVHVDDALLSSDELVPTLQVVQNLLFTGGEQQLLVEKISHSLLNAIKETVSTLAGTSAGAAAMGELMISDNDILLGFGLIPGVIVDQHFSQRNRLGRLQTAVLKTGLLGIGIDEDTAICVRGNLIRIAGRGNVYIVQTDNVFVLAAGDEFDYTLLTQNVSHGARLPDVYPVVNHFVREADDPCVHVSGLTYPSTLF